MTSVGAFEFILLLVVLVMALELAARRLRLPPAAALIIGGLAIALVPGLPVIDLDPDLILVAFLPPLLLAGAYTTSWRAFRANLLPILSLAVGAVFFTTLLVGLVVHWIVPGLPLAACFAIGAIVAPPDAVAAKAVLDSTPLPERIKVLLEGESLLNDAASLVLVRFAVAAALTTSFDAKEAALDFAMLAIGGVIVGAALGWLCLQLLKRLHGRLLVITTTLLLPWAAYIGGERLDVSGVIATVVAGLVLGWHQHVIFTSDIRLRAEAVWEVMVFLMESLIFVLIGLSLKGVIEHVGYGALDGPLFLLPTLAIVAATLLSRFIWVFCIDGPLTNLLVRRRPTFVSYLKTSVVLSWAGMRGVVSLAIALSLPADLPGRDLALVATFAVILVTVLGQGTTMGMIIRWTGLTNGDAHDGRHLSLSSARARMAAAQLHLVQERAFDAAGKLVHPRLLDQAKYRAEAAARFEAAPERFSADRQAHYKIVRDSIAAGRDELLRLHRNDRIDDDVLASLERELDHQEMAAQGRD
ncbi:sodium/proton antiporter, CPA1 family [Arboricoccus pini]|uniref:Sodium/proton antiporter, CPA1 family n=1 Tax=Arboricoccus pini TaxID=1963835 RepID=A0A212RL74_9PROT|nr:Na+/H+ antiporter [Arboricoccus pini]SNB73228.1 sodium/proton antiporter, CPA1 family [Arboricoccus pini]